MVIVDQFICQVYFKKKKKKLLYLAVPDLSCSTWDL